MIKIFPFSLALVSVFTIGADSKPDAPTAESLVNGAPHFIFGGIALRNFRVRGYSEASGVSFDIAVEYDVPGTAPSKLLIALYDRIDQTPVYLAAGGKVLLYDAAKHRAVIGTPPGASFVIKDVGEKGLWVHASFNENNTNTIEIDIPSILANFHDFRAVPISGRGYKLTGTSDRGSTVSALVDPTKPCPYSYLDIAAPGGRPVLLRLEQIAVNGTIPEPMWAFPTASRLKGRLPVTEFDDWWKDRETDDSPFQTLAYRAALRDKSLRPKWEQQYGKIDWDKIEKEDAEASSTIRNAVDDARTVSPNPAPQNEGR